MTNFLLKIIKMINKDVEVFFLNRNKLPVVGDSITVGGRTATFGQEPIVFYTDDLGFSAKDFELDFESKFGYKCMVVHIKPGSEFYAL